MNTKFITASVFAFVSTSVAQAADVIVPQQSEQVVSSVKVFPSFSWTGVYLGAQVGNFSSKSSATVPNVDIPLYPDESSRNKEWLALDKKYMPKLSGFLGGFYAGVNLGLDNHFILGIDTDILLSNKKDTKSTILTEKSSSESSTESSTESTASGSDNEGSDNEASTESKAKHHKKAKVMKGYVGGVSRSVVKNKKEVENSISFFHTLKQKWTGATRVRIGYSAGRMLPYIAGGIAYGQLQDILSISITGEDPFDKVSDVTKTMVGYTIGGGVDFAMTDNMIIRAEYRYSDLGKKKFKDEIELKYKTNDFRVGIAYKF
ncbi:outer membrane protein [Bartonella raoultii]|uniref:Porin family protein n=1 Tax=Bartonella raoultii TaxID=1457020 RepID=A0ABS7I9H3_9HYPH|nr:outer membrane protein [Bartonella raoultii]MBX4336297.1 porin family protein [Bartonella raoultii]